MRNPIQEYNLARSLPIQALANVLRGVSDMVSLGVAHAALKEKMEAEVAKKAAQAMPMAQAPKVVSKDLAMAQGLGSAPADVDVPMGGIVGGEGTFGTGAAGGGSVVAFQPGGSAQLNLPFDDPRMKAKDVLMSTRTPGAGVSFSQAFADKEAAKPKGFMERGLGALRNMPYVGRAFRLASSPMAATASLLTGTDDLNVGEEEYLALINKLASMGYSAEMIEAMTPAQRVAAAEGKLPRGPADTGGVPTQTLAQLEAAQAKPEVAPQDGGLASIDAAQKQVAQPSSYSSLMTQAREMAKKYAPEEKGKKEFKDFSQEYVDTLKAAGYDFDLVKNQIAEVRKEKEALAGEKKEAANLRLLEAGLGILGGESPYAFVNIGKGATPALQGLAKDIKELKKTSRELDKETMQLQLLQNQMAEGKVKYAQGRLDKQEERQAKAVEKKNEIEFRIFDRMSSNETQKYVADIGADTARTNLKAQNLERETKRDFDMREAALKQAAEEFKMEPDTPEKQQKVLARAAEFYKAFKAKDFGAASTGMVATPPPGTTIR
jgi:hypothetical protein